MDTYIYILTFELGTLQHYTLLFLPSTWGHIHSFNFFTWVWLFWRFLEHSAIQGLQVEHSEGSKFVHQNRAILFTLISRDPGTFTLFFFFSKLSRVVLVSSKTNKNPSSISCGTGIREEIGWTWEGVSMQFYLFHVFVVVVHLFEVKFKGF